MNFIISIYIPRFGRGREELEEYIFYEALEFAMEFEDLRVRNWEDLTEEIISLCINELEEYLRRKGGILDIKELVKKLPEHLKKTYGRILYAYRDDVARKIKELEFYKEKIEEIIKELNI